MSHLVQVYFNLHKKVWSIRDKKTRRVIGWLPSLILKDAVFKVSKKGRERVLKEQRKNVHAFIEGERVHNLPYVCDKFVTYNPYKYETFVETLTETPIFNADYVYLRHDRLVEVRNEL
jgi:hypothetical protein